MHFMRHADSEVFVMDLLLIEQQGGFGLPLDLDISLHVLLETFIKGLRE